MSETAKHEASVKVPVLSNTTYDAIKWCAQYFLPAMGTLYFALSTIWGLPYGEQVVGSVVAVDIFLGALLGLSAKSYKASEVDATDGALVVGQSADGFSLEGINIPEYTLEELRNKGMITLRVDSKTL